MAVVPYRGWRPRDCEIMSDGEGWADYLCSGVQTTWRFYQNIAQG